MSLTSIRMKRLCEIPPVTPVQKRRKCEPQSLDYTTIDVETLDVPPQIELVKIDMMPYMKIFANDTISSANDLNPNHVDFDVLKYVQFVTNQLSGQDTNRNDAAQKVNTNALFTDDPYRWTNGKTLFGETSYQWIDEKTIIFEGESYQIDNKNTVGVLEDHLLDEWLMMLDYVS